MIKFILKKLISLLDYFIGHRVASSYGYGHQIDNAKGLDFNSLFIIDKIRNIGSPLKIFEIGCGRGVLATQIISLPNIESYLATDIDQSSLNIFNQRIKNNPNCSIAKTSILDVMNPFNFEEEEFDVVLADKILHLFSPNEVLNIFNFVHSVLKPGGIFLFSSVSTTNPAYSRTSKGETGQYNEMYRKLYNDLLTKLWYNLTRSHVFFINKDITKVYAQQTGFELNEFNICHIETNYYTAGLVKK